MRAWVVRPVVWFATASMMMTILHELAHACAAFALGVRSTLFNYFADLDLTAAQAASNLPALIGVSGPLFCLALGIVCWLAFRKARQSAAALPLLYLAVFGLGTFFGNLMSASFVGDFSAAAASLGVPMPVRYAITIVGAVSVAAIHFRAGRELAWFLPAPIGRMAGALAIIGLPVVLGTAVVMLVNQPMPAASVNARIAEASVWIFAAAGALMTGPHPQGIHGSLALRWTDGAVMLLVVLAVRVMVRGIPLTP